MKIGCETKASQWTAPTPPDWPERGDLARRAGHGGGDFWTNFHFVRAIRSGRQPYLNVYRGVAMAAVGVQAWRSCLENGAPLSGSRLPREDRLQTLRGGPLVALPRRRRARPASSQHAGLRETGPGCHPIRPRALARARVRWLTEESQTHHDDPCLSLRPFVPRTVFIRWNKQHHQLPITRDLSGCLEWT